MRLLLASGNPKKIAELERMLAPIGVELCTPADIDGLADVDEDQPTFLGNARKKALAAAAASGLWSLADDSGLEVDYLNGAPGVNSARFAGDHGDDEANNRLLLEKLAGVPEEERGARFVCALVLADPDGNIVAEFEGNARGRILLERLGDRDFGYDPYFLFTEEGFAATGKGFAELDPDGKSAVSHRGRALRSLIEHLETRASR